MENERQKKLLYLIVFDYIKYGNPISSFSLLKNHDNINLSSATLRNEMLSLEKEGYIEKAHKSSGRIPTNKGYEFYIENIEKKNSETNLIKNKIDKLFTKRNKNIDDVIEEAISIITDATNTFAISHEDNKDVKIEDMHFYEVKKNKFLTLVIDSNGKLFNKEIFLKNDENEIENVKSALKIISKRIIGIKISDIEKRLNYIFELISKELKNIEQNFQVFIIELFKQITTREINYTNGLNNIVRMDFYNKREQIEKIFNIIQENSIWDLISKQKGIKHKDTKILISLDNENLNDVSLIEKTIKVGDSIKKIAFIGSKNQDYQKLVNMIDILDENLKE
ncbi:MAG: heat-inducible transcription repressor HrcA [Candidatus Hepatoplasma vulgare]|nr:MAG: heat-inducible transcription repressor HrcA [Candidatus Hepatoplasma sp.]